KANDPSNDAHTGTPSASPKRSAPSFAFGRLIVGRTFLVRFRAAPGPTACLISGPRAKPSRRRNSLMNALSDCWYRNQPKTASDTVTINATKYNDIAIHVPDASAEHRCA